MGKNDVSHVYYDLSFSILSVLLKYLTMNKLLIHLTTTMLLILWPLGLFAHSGHGSFQNSFLHYFSSPLHLAEAGLLVFVVGYFLARKYSRKMR
jgi:hypothetical protein